MSRSTRISTLRSLRPRALLGGILGPVYVILFTPEPHSIIVALVAIPFGAFAGVVAGFIVGAVVDGVWAVVRGVKSLRARRRCRRLERLQGDLETLRRQRGDDQDP